jgi:predicted amidohydrolase YtcJ
VPSTLYRNGVVHSPADPFAEAVLVADGQVAWLGSEETVHTVLDSVDRVVDLDGALVTPGFVDAHAHVLETGFAIEGVDLSAAGAPTLAAALDVVAAAARAARDAGRTGPLVGHGWDETLWPEGRPPTREEVDRASGGAKSRAERDAWTLHNLALVQMTHAKDKRPSEISGGMKQRVGIARALAMEPKVLLLDEPFGALDALTRAQLQDSVMEIHAKLGNTVLMITHDVDEAVLLSDRIVMMTNGPAATIGEILRVDLARPRNRVELAEDTAYTHFRKAVLDFLYTRHGHVEKAA